jgi:hypothetical protein
METQLHDKVKLGIVEKHANECELISNLDLNRHFIVVIHILLHTLNR